MKKRGFTLIEIIVCISLIALIGVGCFVGIKFRNNKIKISKLEQITDKAIQAAQVYLETNKESHNQLYNNHNGVVLPLNVLVEEGLLNIQDTGIKKTDYENEYVISFLESSPGNVSECIDVRTETSWQTTSSAPIYICTHTTKEYKLDGAINYIGQNPANYLKYKGKTFRIMKIDLDKTVIAVSSENNVDVKLKQDTVIEYITAYSEFDYNQVIPQNTYYYCDDSFWRKCYLKNYDTDYIYNAFDQKDAWGYQHENFEWTYIYKKYKYHFNECYEINGGTGDISDPFTLNDSKC